MHETSSFIDSIDKNEEISRSLESHESSREQLLKAVSSYSESFLNRLNDEKAYEKEGYQDKQRDLAFNIRDEAQAIDDVLAFLKERVDKPGLNPASAGHLGYIPGGGIYEAALGDYIAAITNRYAGVYFASPGAVRMENTLIKWAGELLGYTGHFGGNLTSGGSIANLIAISTARSAMKLKGKDLHKTVIYSSQQTHHSIKKALKICGLEECIVRLVSLDEYYRIIPSALETLIDEDEREGLNPFLIITNAGSTDVGAIDPLEDIAQIAQSKKLWLHVDAAYGGFFMLTNYGKQRMKGIEQADSVILDPHKGLFLPYGTGMVIIKDIQHLAEANGYEANYMQDTLGFKDEFSPAELSPELSKHFRGMRLWLPLKIHGLSPFKAALEEKLGLAAYFNEKVKELGFETAPFNDLSVVIFRYTLTDGNVNSFNEQLAKHIQEDGRIFISTTTLHQQFMLRVAILSFRTHKKEVDLLLHILEDYIRENKNSH